MSPVRPDHGLLLPVRLVPRQLRGDLQDIPGLETGPAHAAQARITRIGQAMHKGKVTPHHAVALELRGKVMMRMVRLGRHQQARGVLVNAVDNAGPPLAANA